MSRRRHEEERGSRAEQKQLTRQALLDGALRLLETRSFDGLSLREVTREVGLVPTAFYRHFESMDELGLELVSDTTRTLRRMMRAARDGGDETNIIRRSVQTFVQYVQAHRAQFRFLLRERYGGAATIRNTIGAEIRLFTSELATDLARQPAAAQWSTEDLHMLAGLFVSTVLTALEHILDSPRGPDLDAVARTTERQLRLIVLGALQWRSDAKPR
ncbi:Transcriptional regulator, TetR family protein [Minicystis rosea]|nr:Transcriptional regulator, TetR family protein [Minicystis rosea]